MKDRCAGGPQWSAGQKRALLTEELGLAAGDRPQPGGLIACSPKRQPAASWSSNFRRLKPLGFSLEEIPGIAAVHDAGDLPAATLRIPAGAARIEADPMARSRSCASSPGTAGAAWRAGRASRPREAELICPNLQGVRRTRLTFLRSNDWQQQLLQPMATYLITGATAASAWS